MPSKKNVLSPYVILTLSARSRKDVIIHGPNGDILYWIETSGGSTFVYRASPFPSLTNEGTQGNRGVEVSKQQIAKLDFKIFQKSMITYNEIEQEVAEFLPRERSWRGVSVGVTAIYLFFWMILVSCSSLMICHDRCRRAQTPIGQLKWAPGKMRPHVSEVTSFR